MLQPRITREKFLLPELSELSEVDCLLLTYDFLT